MPRDPLNGLLPFLSSQNGSTIFSTNEKWQRGAGLGGGHLLREQLPRKRTVSSSPGIQLALTTLLSLAIVYLLYRCVAHLKLGYNKGGESRKLAEGGHFPHSRGCSAEDAFGEGAEQAEEEDLEDMGDNDFGAEEAGDGAEEDPSLRRWEGRRVPEDRLITLQSIMKRLERIATTCSYIVSHLSAQDALQVLWHVVRLQALDLAFFSLGLPTLEEQRQQVIGMYMKMIRAFLHRRPREVDEEKRDSLTRLLRFLKESRKTRLVTYEVSAKVWKIGILTGSDVSGISSAYAESSVERLRSALTSPTELDIAQGEKWCKIPKRILDRELDYISAIRDVRVMQVLAAKSTRSWLYSCQRPCQGWPCFSLEELNAAQRGPGLPSLAAQTQQIRLVANRAARAGDIPGVAGHLEIAGKACHEHAPPPGAEASVEGVPEEEPAPPGDVALAYGQFAAPGAHPSQRHGRAHQRASLLRSLDRTTHDMFSQLFTFLESIATIALSMERMCDNEVYLQLARCLAKLAAVELSACTALPDTLDFHRGQLALHFARLARQALAANPESTGSPAAQELRDLLRLLETLDRAIQFWSVPSSDAYNTAMGQHSMVAHLAAERLNSLLMDLANSASIELTSLTMQPLLSHLENLADTRLSHVLRRGLLRYCMTNAQRRAGVEVLASVETSDEPGDIRTESMMTEVLLVHTALRDSSALLLQMSWLHRADPFSRDFSTPEQWQEQGYAASYPGDSLSGWSHVQADMESGTGAAAATELEHFQVLYGFHEQSGREFVAIPQQEPFSAHTDGGAAGFEGPEPMPFPLSLSWQQADPRSHYLTYYDRPEDIWAPSSNLLTRQQMFTTEAAGGIAEPSASGHSQTHQTNADSRRDSLAAGSVQYSRSREGAEKMFGPHGPQVLLFDEPSSSRSAGVHLPSDPLRRAKPRRYSEVRRASGAAAATADGQHSIRMRPGHRQQEGLTSSQYEHSTGTQHLADPSAWEASGNVGWESSQSAETSSGRSREGSRGDTEASSAIRPGRHSDEETGVRGESGEANNQEADVGHSQGGAVGAGESEDSHALEDLRDIVLDIAELTLEGTPQLEEK